MVQHSSAAVVRIVDALDTRACLQGRNPDELALHRAINAYEAERNAKGTTINWRFTTQDARTKLQRLYPCHFKID